MAAANESQGLKIAVAAFVALAVILAVTTYFGYSQYGQAQAKYEDAEKKLQTATRAIDDERTRVTKLKQLAGYGAIEDFAAVEAAVTKNDVALGEKLATLQKDLNAAVEEYKAAGGNDKKVEDLNSQIAQSINSIQTEPNKTFQSKLDRMMEITANSRKLMQAMDLDNQALRKAVDTLNDINQQKLDQEIASRKKAEDDLNALTQTKETERAGLLARVDQLQTLTRDQATKIATLENEVNTLKTTHAADLAKMQQIMRTLREKSEANEYTLGRPSGRVTVVNYADGLVRVNLNRRQGAREQMVFSIFDRDAPGIPTERPKAMIELIQVGDRDSIARIDKEKTKEMIGKIDPRTGRQPSTIRVGDLIYSPAFNPGEPKRFALLGKIDIDRDGVDDRDRLRRMIQMAGGVIAYDLPPTGRATGSLDGPTDVYVFDERTPIRNPNVRTEAAVEDNGFEKKNADARQRLRDEGVQPMPVQRLLDYLGYTPGIIPPDAGKVERLNQDVSRDLQNPKGRTGVPATVPPAETPEGDQPEQP